MAGNRPQLRLPSPYGRAFLQLPEHMSRGLLKESFAPVQSDGELLVGLCYEQVDPADAVGDESIHFLLSEDLAKGWSSCLVRYSVCFNCLVDNILSTLPQPTDVQDRAETVKALTNLLLQAKLLGATPCMNEMGYCVQDRASWTGWALTPTVAPTPIAKWRHWRPSRMKNDRPITQRRLEQELRERWAMKLISRLALFADKIPTMAAVRGPRPQPGPGVRGFAG